MGKSSNLDRKTKGRTAQDYSIIVAYDGEKTEDSYFRGWRQIIPFHRLNLRPVFVKSGGNPLVAIKKCEREIRKCSDFAEFWCVCDVDDATQEDISLAKQLAESIGVRLCLSVRCFEIWILLHFSVYSRALSTEAEAIKAVQCHFPEFGNPTKIADFAELYPQTESAIMNGHRLEALQLGDPATSLHNLVRKLYQNQL